MKTVLNHALLFVLASLLAVRSARAANDARPTVAVLYFDYSGQDAQLTVLRKGLAQMLISDLSPLDGVRIVERDRLEAVLTELALQKSGKIDPATAAKVGKLLGARYMVLGGYFDLMKTLRADARVVEVETGKVVDSVGVSGQPDDFLVVEQGLATGIAKILTTKTTPLPGTTAPTSSSTAAKKPRVAPPSRLKTQTAVNYSKALESIDRGDRATAKTALAQVVKEQPDFRLASLDMDHLIQ